MDVDEGVEAWPGTWLVTAGKVLGEGRVEEARAHLAAGLLGTTGVRRAVRVRVDGSGAVSCFVAERGGRTSVIQLSARHRVHEHPFHQVHVVGGVADPVRLTDVIASGRPLPEHWVLTLQTLRLSVHQLSVPVEQPGDDGGYEGWLLLDDSPIGEEVLRTMCAVQPLLSGLDRHLRLLGVLVPAPARPLLTPREALVLSMLAEGCTVSAVARQLLISPRTVHKHQEHLYRKLGAQDRLSAVLRGQELGLLPRGRSAPAPARSPVSGQLPPMHAGRFSITSPSSIMKSSSPR